MKVDPMPWYDFLEWRKVMVMERNSSCNLRPPLNKGSGNMWTVIRESFLAIYLQPLVLNLHLQQLVHQSQQLFSFINSCRDRAVAVD